MNSLHRSWIVFYAILLHYTWAVLLLTSDRPLQTAPVSALAHVPQIPACILLFVVATCALSGVFWLRQPWLRLLVLLPQQVLMMMSALGAATLIIEQHYADGVIRPFAFIAADQASGIIAAIFHTVALIEAFGPSSWRICGFHFWHS